MYQLHRTIPKPSIRNRDQSSSRIALSRIDLCIILTFIVVVLVLPSDAYGQTTAGDTLSTSELKQLSLEDLMDIEVTSVSKHPEKLSETASAIQVITSDEIHRSGATSIPEALRLADNLDVAQNASSGWNISARGFNAAVGNKLLVLIDGRSVYTPLFSGVIWNMQGVLLNDIDRIEVISGPGGTLWGANAVNGVINIITKQAKESQGLYVETGGGSTLKDFGSVRYGGTLSPNVYFRAYGKYVNEGSQVVGSGTGASDSWNRGQGGFRIDDEQSPRNQLALQGDIYTGETDLAPGKVGKAGGGNIVGRWIHKFSDENDMTLQMYYDRAHLADPFPSSLSIPAGELKDDLDTYDLDFQDRLQLGGWNRVVWGLGYRFTHDVVVDAPIVAFIPGTLNQKLFSVFVQDEITLYENLALTLGSKLEHNDYTGYEAEPNGRLQCNITDKQMIWGAVSRAVRAPSRYDRDLYQPDPQYTYPYYLVGNSTFKSETVIAYELGYRARLSGNISGSLSAFYNNYDHLRSLNYAIVPPGVLDIFYENNLRAATKGLEFAGDYEVTDRWRVHLGYDLLKEDVYVVSGTVDLDSARNETADPQQQIFLRSSMNLPHEVELDAAVRGIDMLHNNNGSTIGTIPGYFELDVRLGWHPLETVELSVVGQNLLHKRHPEYGFPSPAREEIERSVYGKLSFSL